MSALARYFNSMGVHVFGYDKTKTPLTETLEQEGIYVIYEDDPEGFDKQPDAIIYTPAIPTDSRLLKHFSASGLPIHKRSEVLGFLSAETPTIAIAGTHGKTTICAMLTHILKQAGIACVSLMGGISSNYNTNYIGDHNPLWMIAEADEYDRSFLQLSPRIALISAIDSDHLDVYGNHYELIRSFSLFAQKTDRQGVLLAKNDIARHIGFSGKHYNYSMEKPADYFLSNVGFRNGQYHASIDGLLKLPGLTPGQPGRHNLENALAAAAVAHQAGIDANSIRYGINSFKGVKRRFEIIYQTKNIIFVDDYAHHPEEIKKCINSAREMWPGKKITGIFQPHLFSRTKDLADEFALSFTELDELILLDIYPAREQPIPGVNAHMLLEKIKQPNAIFCKKDQLLSHLKKSNLEVLITMGAGNIDRLTDKIKQVLTEKEQ